MTVRRFIDIGANLTDPMFQGMYYGSRKHVADLDQVLARAWNIGMEKIIVTGGSLEDSMKALDLVRDNSKLYSTVGCHPTRSNEFDIADTEEYYNGLASLIRENPSKVVALGECGLDYDRVQFCNISMQKKYFRIQLNLCNEVKLPLFLHCRNAARDFVEILDDFPHVQGVVHSFDGTWEEAEVLLKKGFYIGINGCSLKTEASLLVALQIPNDRLMIETDAPWCEVRPSHAGYRYVRTTFPAVKKERWEPDLLVRGRNEPVNIVQILEILTALKQADYDSLAHQIYENTMKLFFPYS